MGRPKGNPLKQARALARYVIRKRRRLMAPGTRLDLDALARGLPFGSKGRARLGDVLVDFGIARRMDDGTLVVAENAWDIITCIVCGMSRHKWDPAAFGRALHDGAGGTATVCSTCAKQIPLPGGAPAQEIAVFLLSRRRQEKAARMAARLRRALPALPWEDIERRAADARQSFFAEQRRRQQEAEEKAARDWQTAEAEFDSIIAAALDDIPGVAWEIADLARVGKAGWVIKLRVTPWGTTFLEGTPEEIESDVLRIARDIRRQQGRIRCPTCHATIQASAPNRPRLCPCGNRILWAGSRAVGLPCPIDEDAWPTLRRLAKIPETLPDECFAGFDPGDVIAGCHAFRPFGWSIYVVEPAAAGLRPSTELPYAFRVGALLAQLGFAPRLQSDFHRRRRMWLVEWNGTVKGHEVTVTVGDEFFSEPLDDAPEFRDPRGTDLTLVFPGGLLRVADDAPDGVADDIYERWAAHLLDRPEIGGWMVSDDIVFFYEAREGARLTAPLALDPDDEAAAGQLLRALEEAVDACLAAVREFLGGLSPDETRHLRSPLLSPES